MTGSLIWLTILHTCNITSAWSLTIQTNHSGVLFPIISCNINLRTLIEMRWGSTLLNLSADGRWLLMGWSVLLVFISHVILLSELTYWWTQLTCPSCHFLDSLVITKGLLTCQIYFSFEWLSGLWLVITLSYSSHNSPFIHHGYSQTSYPTAHLSLVHIIVMNSHWCNFRHKLSKNFLLQPLNIENLSCRCWCVAIGTRNLGWLWKCE